MSREHLLRFSEAYERDTSLRAEMDRLRDDEKAWRQRARERGFDLTPEEVRGLTSGYEELSEDDLEAVAGGWDDPEGGTEPPPEPPPGGGP